MSLVDEEYETRFIVILFCSNTLRMTCLFIRMAGFEVDCAKGLGEAAACQHVCTQTV